VALTRKPVWLFGDLCLENVQISQQKGSRALGRICVCQEKILGSYLAQDKHKDCISEGRKCRTLHSP